MNPFVQLSKDIFYMACKENGGDCWGREMKDSCEQRTTYKTAKTPTKHHDHGPVKIPMRVVDRNKES